jgi:hypothetical protein
MRICINVRWGEHPVIEGNIDCSPDTCDTFNNKYIGCEIAMKRKDKSKHTIAGIVVPSTWDNKGNVTGVTIQAYDEKAYMVEHALPGEELLSHIHEKVEVDGKIRERINGSISIRVKSYRVMAEVAESQKLPTG